MKTRRLDLWVGLLAVLCLFPLKSAHGGHVSRYESNADQSDVIIKGTSTFHDWSAEGHVINGCVEVTEKQMAGLLNGEIPATISASQDLKVTVAIPVMSLKSKLKGLEERMWKDLDYRKHPNILYSFVKADVKHGTMSTGYSFDTEGELTVNGVTRILTMSATFKVSNADEMVVEGETAVKMTDFNIAPPRLLAGLIKTGNEVRILIRWPVARKPIGQDQ